MKAGKNRQVVQRLMDAVNDRDHDRVVSFMSDDTAISHTGLDEVLEAGAIWEVMLPIQEGVEAVDWQVDALDEDECGDVITEGQLRIMRDGAWQAYPVKGRFAVKGCKIVGFHGVQ